LIAKLTTIGDLASHCHERLINTKKGMKVDEENGGKWRRNEWKALNG